MLIIFKSSIIVKKQAHNYWSSQCWLRKHLVPAQKEKRKYFSKYIVILSPFSTSIIFSHDWIDMIFFFFRFLLLVINVICVCIIWFFVMFFFLFFSIVQWFRKYFVSTVVIFNSFHNTYLCYYQTIVSFFSEESMISTNVSSPCRSHVFEYS